MLYPGEKRAVALFCAALLLMVFLKEVSWIRISEPGAFEEAPPLVPMPLITIEIKGAVEKEGLFHVPKGSTLMEALDLAAPLPDADLSKLPIDKSLLRKQTIRVPRKKLPKQTAY